MPRVSRLAEKGGAWRLCERHARVDDIHRLTHERDRTRATVRARLPPAHPCGNAP